MLYKELKVPFFTTLFIFGFLFLYTKTAGPIPFYINSIQTTKTDLFHVSGTGKATVIPDTGVLSFAVSKTALTAQDAQQQTNLLMNKIMLALKELGIPEKNIKTTNYSVYPEYDYSLGRQAAKGYTVTQNIEVKVKPIDKANKAIDIATANGATNISQLSFTIDDEEMKNLQDQARKEAIEEAKTKASSLANNAGIHLGKVVDVSEDSGNPPPIRYDAMNMAKSISTTDSQPTQITPGESTITVTVTLSYQVY